MKGTHINNAKMNIFLSILVFFLFDRFVSAQSLIFSALPAEIIKEKSGDIVSPLVMVKVESKQLILMSCGESGIALYSESTKQIQMVGFDQIVEQINVIDNDKYIIVGFLTYISVLELKQQADQSFILLPKQKQEVNIISIKLLYLKQMQKILILGLSGTILCFNYEGQGIIQPSQTFKFKRFNILSGEVSLDERFLFISIDPNNIEIYKINQIQTTAKNGTTSTQLKLTFLKELFSNYEVKEMKLIEINDFFIYYIDSWLGLYYADIKPLNYTNPTAAEIDSIKGIYFGVGEANVSPTTICMIISQQQTYLYLGVRSQGVLIYDISDKTKPNLYYQLYVDAQAYSLMLSMNEEILYYSNSNGLYQYQTKLLQLGNDIPNLFNHHRSKSLLDGGSFYKWRCQISKNSQVLYGAFDVDMLQRYYISHGLYEGSIELQPIDTIPYPSNNISETPYIDTILMDSNEQFLFVPVISEEYSAIKYEIPDDADVFQPLIIKAYLNINDIQYTETMRLSQDNKYIVMAYVSGIVIVDSDDFQVITYYVIQDIKQSCFGVDFTRDQKFIFATARNLGIWIINVQNIQEPTVISVLRTRGGESVRSSKIYDIMYILDGSNGVLLYDSSLLPLVKMIGQIKLQGWVNDITLLSDENYGIVSTMDRGMIWLINLINKKNPLLVSSYQISQQNAQSTCIDPLMQYLFILNAQGVRYFPLISNVKIHFECALQSPDLNSYFSRIINENEYLEVGQSYELRLIPLYSQSNQIISNVYLYSDQQIITLPSWINHSAEQFVTMNIPKEAIDVNNNSMLTLLVKTSFSFNESSFIFNTTTYSTSPNLSYSIYQFLKTNSFLDNQDLLTDLYNPEVQLAFNDFGTEITDPTIQKKILARTRDILQNSIDYNPISYKVRSSLYYIFEKSNNTYEIQTISSTVSIRFSFSLNQSLIFVQKNYPNVITYRDDQYTSLNFQSQIESINYILQQKIIYFKQNCSNSTNNTESDISHNNLVQISISDGINNDLNSSFPISQLSFLKLKSIIKQSKPLQPQIEKISNDSNFPIESSLTIQFEQDSFVDPDQIPLYYSILMLQNNNYLPIPPQHFLKFDTDNIRLSGTPSADNLFEKINLRLVITNTYTTTYSEFYIQINKVSLMYVLNQMIRVLGPLAFFLGIYKQKNYFINAIWKKKTIYSKENAIVNSQYRKKITLLGNELIIASLFFDKFCKKNIHKTIFHTQQDPLQNNNSEYIMDSYCQSDKEDKEDKEDKDEYTESRKNISLQHNNQNNISYPQNINTTLNKNNSSFDALDILNQGNQSNEKELKYKNSHQVQNQQKRQSLQIKSLKSTPLLELKPILNKFKQVKAGLPINGSFGQQRNSKIYTSGSDLKQPQNFPLMKKQTFKLNEQEEIKAQEARKNLQEAKKKKLPLNDIIFNFSYSNPQVVYNLQMYSNQQIYNLDSDENYLLDIRITADNIFNKMLLDGTEITFKNKKLKICSYIKEYQNKYSRFHYCLHACIVNYLLRLDTRTQVVYKYFKKYAKNSLNFTNKDWYKAYVKVEPTNEFDSNGLPIPFSKIHINELNFIPCLSHLQIYGEKKSILNNIWEHGINPFLLKEAMKFASLGLLTSNFKRGFMNKSKGESIHLQQHEILSVEAFKLKQHSRMVCLRKLFNLEYQRLPISKYLSLPSWIQFDCKNGVIMLEGLPSLSDIEEVLIRVYNTQQCIIMQFFLNISDEANPDHLMQSLLENNQQLLNSSDNMTDGLPTKIGTANSLHNLNNPTDMLSKRKKRSVFSVSPSRLSLIPSYLNNNNVNNRSQNSDNLLQQSDSNPKPQDIQQLELITKLSINSMNNSHEKQRTKGNKFSIFLTKISQQYSNKEDGQNSEESANSSSSPSHQSQSTVKNISKPQIPPQISYQMNKGLSMMESFSSESESLDHSHTFTGENHNLPKQTSLYSNVNPFVETVSEAYQ